MAHDTLNDGRSRRLMLTVGRKQCPFGCVYCFTDFSQYRRPPTLEDVERGAVSLEGVDVVYPSCDVDLYALAGWRSILDRAADLGKSISISTKAALGPEQIEHAASVARALDDRGAVLKIGFSFATRSGCAALEPRAAPYGDRVAGAATLARAGVETALVLRPLLADVDPAEYAGIVEDARSWTALILTGPEHLDDDESHPRRTIGAPHTPAAPRTITWATGSPAWLSREASPQLRSVRGAASRLGMSVFERDLDLMDVLLRATRLRKAPAAG